MSNLGKENLNFCAKLFLFVQSGSHGIYVGCIGIGVGSTRVGARGQIYFGNARDFESPVPDDDKLGYNICASRKP